VPLKHFLSGYIEPSASDSINPRIIQIGSCLKLTISPRRSQAHHIALRRTPQKPGCLDGTANAFTSLFWFYLHGSNGWPPLAEWQKKRRHVGLAMPMAATAGCVPL
jgi:hypothetical protein